MVYLGTVIDPNDPSIEHKVEIETDPKKVSFEKFVEFAFKTNSITRFIISESKKYSEDNEHRFREWRLINKVIDAVNAFTGIPTHLLERFELGDTNDFLKRYGKHENKVDGNESIHMALYDLYDMCYKIINEYKPKLRTDDQNCHFTIQGKRLVIPRITVQGVLKKTRVPRLKTFEVIETLEIERVYNMMIDGVKGDDDEIHSEKRTNVEVKAELEFIKAIKKISILSRETGEVVPTDELEMNDWIDERMILISGHNAKGERVGPGISMSDALDALFFLDGILKN